MHSHYAVLMQENAILTCSAASVLADLTKIQQMLFHCHSTKGGLDISLSNYKQKHQRHPQMLIVEIQ